MCLGLLASGLVLAALALAAGVLTADPDTLTFTQDIDDGATTSQVTTIANDGDEPVTLTGVAIEGPNADAFAVEDAATTCDEATVLAPTDACEVHVTFDPEGVDANTATLRVTSDAPDETVALDGTGIDTRLDASPTSHDFGTFDVDDGADAEESSWVENLGTETITIDDVERGGDAAFEHLTGEPGDCVDGTELERGQGCNLRIGFDPLTTGTQTGSLTLHSSAVPDQVVTFTGEGTQTELTADPDTLPFGDQDVDDGSTAVQTSIVENTGTETVVFSARTLGGTDELDFAHLTDQATDCASTGQLAPNDTCNVRIRFDPDGTGAKSATLTLESNAPDTVIALSGTGTQTQLTADPDSMPFGAQDVDDGATATQTSEIENTGTEPVDLDAVTVGGADAAHFQLLSDQGADCTAATTLSAGETCAVRLAFDPATTGARSATVTVTSNADDAVVALSGTGTQTEVTVTPDTLGFGDQDVDDGDSASETSTLENTGTEPVIVGDVVIGGTDAGEFSQVAPVAGDCQGGTALAPGQDCAIRVTFDPTTTGAKAGTVTVQSNAADAVVALTGTGTQTELTAAPATLAFGDRDVNEGPTATQESTVTNTGSEPVSLVAVDATGDTGQFERLTGQGTDCTAATTLNAGDDCRIRVRFDPTSTGAKSVTYTVDSNAADVTADATGTGTLKELSAGPVELPFGAQDVDAGPSPQQESVVQNTGDQPITIAAITIGGANPRQFQRISGGPGHCAPASVLEPGNECDLRLVFDPSFKGPKSATVTVDSNAPDVTVALTGTGIEAVYESSDDPLDEAHVTNGQVNAVAFDSLGRTYLGGTFTSVGPRTGHGVKLSQASDEPASGFPDVDGTIRAVAPDGSGGWFIGGDFTSVGGLPRARLAHVLPSGGVDAAWDPVADGRVSALAVSGGSLFVGGEFATIDGVQRAFVAKLSATSGALDATWNAQVDSRVTAIAVNTAGVHLGGDFTQVRGEPRSRLARVSRLDTGAVDESWAPDADGTVDAIALSAAGDVYVGGAFTTVGGLSRARIAKLAPDTGAADPGWNPGASNRVSALAVDGAYVYAGGSFTSIGGEPRNRLARLTTAEGVVDAAFNPDANAPVHALAVTGTVVYAGGEFTQIGGQSRSRLARLASATGAADAWDPSANGTVRALAVAGTDLYAGGDFTSVGASARNRLARLAPDGTLDPDWDPDANGTVSSLVVSGSDVYVGGSFTSVGGQARDRIAKLSVASGAADPAWNPGATGTVSALAVSGTTVYAGGLFSTIDGQPRSRLARLTGASGDLDTAWLPAGAGGQVNALALAGPDLFAGGSFMTIGGEPRARVAKLAAGGTGAVDPAWNPGASNTVSALAVDGSDLYAGGFFSTIGGEARNFVAQLDTASGLVDPAWDPNPNSIVRAIALSPSDVYIGGDFTTVSGQPHNRLAKLPKTGAGTADSGWDPGVTGGNVLALAVAGDRLAVGGSFTAIDGQSAQAFALLELPTLTADPGGLHFPERDVDDGPSGVLESTITNPRSEPITFTDVSLGGPGAAHFELLGDDPEDCSVVGVLEQDETCTVRARFDPATAGLKTARVRLVSNSPGIDVALTGTGTQTGLSPDPASLDLGAQDIDDGATAVQTSTVLNAGTEQVDFADVALGGADAAHFQLLSDQPGDCTATTILQPTQSCAVRVAFDPTTVGMKSAAVTIDSSAPDAEIPLVGSGIQTSQTRSPATLPFGPHDIDDGPTTAQESTVTNTGTEAITFSDVATTGDADQFVRLTDDLASDCRANLQLDAGETCKVRVRFDPTTVGAKAATVTLTSQAGALTVDLSGTGTQTQLTADPDAMGFGPRDVDDGATATQESVVTNTGTEPITVAAVDVTGDGAHFVRLTDDAADCAPSDTLAPTETCKVRVQFDPTTVGAKSATVTVDSNAPDETIALTGTGIQTELSRSPASLSFGSRDVDDGPSAVDESTVTNSGTEPVDLDAVTLGGADAGQFERLTGQGTDCTDATTLTAGQTCKLRVRFDPSTTGAKAASVTVESNAADVVVTLAGTGVQTELSRSPATLAFGNQNINEGPTATQESTVTNSGSEPITFTAIAFTGDTGHFERLTGQPTDCTSTTELAAGQTCKLRARFDPSTTGAKAATITVDSNAADITVALSGTGVLTQLQHSDGTLAFGPRDIDEGPTSVLESTITNSGSETVTFSSVAVTGDTTQFERLTGEPGDCADDTVLAAGQTCDVRARFDPTTTGAKSATVTIGSNASDQVITLTGTGTQTLLTRSPDTLPFGPRDIDEGATAVQTSTVTNAGSETVDLDAVSLTGDDGQFERLTSQGTDCTADTSLTAGQTCELRVRFDPTTTGAKAATLTVESNAADVAVALSGTGTQTQLTADPGEQAYGAQDVDDGQTAPRTSVIENTGSETVTFTGITVDAGWVRLTGEATDCADDESLAAGEECDLRIAFDPTARGAQTGEATIASNAPDETVALSGTGTQTELSRSPDTLTFGERDINEGPTAAQESTVTNSGTEPVTLSAVAVTGDAGHFERLTSQASDCAATATLTAGQTCTLRFRFDPTSTGAKTATVTVDSNAADVTVALTGTGTLKELTLADAALAFGPQDIDDGATDTQQTTVENTGDQTVTIAEAGLADTENFVLLGDGAEDCGMGVDLEPGETCVIRVRFDPATVGAKSASVAINSSAPDETLALSGTGIQTLLTTSADSHSFGSQDIDEGPTAARSSTITNAGTETVDLDAVTVGGADASHFELLGGEATDCTAATTLTAGQTCVLRVRFDPSTMGAKSASATIASNADDVSVALDGTGIQTLLTRSPDTLPFGPQDIDDGATAVQTSTVTNAGSETVDLDAVAVTGDSGFERLTSEAGDCTAATTLTANQTCTLRFRFDPATTGAKAATVTVDSNAADVSVALTGTGTQTLLSESQAALAFGDRDVDDGATATKTSTITNVGTEPVTLVAVALTGDTGHFDHLADQAEDCAASDVLTAGQSCDVRLRFDPATTGAKALTATIDSNAADVAVTASGEGIQTELSPSPANLPFGARDIDEGPTATQTATVTNSGTEPVTLTSVAVTGDDAQFVRLTSQASDCAATDLLTAGQACEVRFRFDPTSTGVKTATVTVASNAADVSVALTGTGTQTLLSQSPPSLAFGSQDVDDGPTAVKESTITNAGTETVDLDGVTVGGADAAQFERLTGEASDCTASTTLAAAETCKVRLRFDPATTGAKAATATVESDAADVTVTLGGTGIQTELSRSPAVLSFGDRDIDDGASAAKSSTVTNSGTEPVTIAGVDVTGQFERVTGAGTDCVAGAVLAAGQTCALRVRFDPSTTGAKTGAITVDSNAADVTVALSGTGTQTLLDVGPASLTFGSREVDGGASAAQTSTVTNTGTEPVDVDAVTLGGANPLQFERLSGQAGDCSATTLLPAGGTCELRVRFDPSARGPKAATVTVDSANAADVGVTLSGTGIDTELTASPAALAFGSHDIDDGPTAVHESTVANTGTETVTFEDVGLTGSAPDFTVVTGAAGDCEATTTLAPDETCKVRVRFDPATVGAKANAFEVDSDAPTTTIAITGTGTQTLIEAAPTALAFGAHDVDDGPTLGQQSTITNAGTEPVTLAGVSVAGADAAVFERLTGQVSDCGAGDTLAGGATCRVRVRFDPAATGARAATVTVDAQGPAVADVTVGLSGTGIQSSLSNSSPAIAFGARDVDDGPGEAQSSTIANTGTEPIAVQGVAVTGADAGEFQRLAGEGSDCEAGRTLGAGDSCTVRARFDPSATGPKVATIGIDTSESDLSVALTGAGTQTQLSLAPAALAFGARNLGEGPSAPQAAAVRNVGTEPITLGAVTISGDGASQFAALGGQPADCAAGRVLAGGAECAVRTAFDPSSTGAKAATLVVGSSAGELRTALTGTGTAVRLVLGTGPTRASQTKRRSFRVQLSALGGVVPRATLTLSRAGGGRLMRMVVRNVSARRTVTFRLRRALPRGRYKVTATAPATTQVGRATRTYRLR